MKRIEREQRVRDLEVVILWAFFLIILHYLWPSDLWIPLCSTILLFGLLMKRGTSRVVQAWLGFSGVLSRLNSRVVLTLVFFLSLTPLALLYRLFTKNPLMLKKDRKAPTYFKNRNHTFGRKDFEKMW